MRCEFSILEFAPVPEALLEPSKLIKRPPKRPRTIVLAGGRCVFGIVTSFGFPVAGVSDAGWPGSTTPATE
jgi:hypothetical protein